MLREYDCTVSVPIFANGAAFAAFASAISSIAQSGNSDGYSEPDNITDHVQDMGLDLDVENGVLKGEVVIGCTSGGGAQCAEAIKNMKALNARADIDIDIQQVGPNESYDIALRFDKNLPSGGSYTDRYLKLFKSWRWNRTITLNPNSARPNAALHEFGHAIGLGHQSNSTNSIMSYSSNRQPRLRDVETERLRRAY